MTAIASVHAHESADFEKAANQVNNMWFNAIGHIPYLTGGKTGDDMARAERESAVEQYKQWKLEKKTPPGLEELTPKDDTG